MPLKRKRALIGSLHSLKVSRQIRKHEILMLPEGKVGHCATERDTGRNGTNRKPSLGFNGEMFFRNVSCSFSWDLGTNAVFR